MSQGFRCAAESSALAEPLAGTASTVRAFLLLECPGPWGVQALRDCRLPEQLSVELERRCVEVGVRPLLIRRHGRSQPESARCFAVYADPHDPWTESVTLTRAEDVLDLPVERLADGQSLGLERHDDPLFLVCTHGRHDPCCAERGRPAAAALASAFTTQTWECSHIGGDRFAGNMLVLPDGLYYGRADRDTAVRIASAHMRGDLDLDHLRGRAGFGFAVQAAEWHLRRKLDLTAVDALRLVGQRSHSGVTEALFVVDGQRWHVRIGAHRSAPHQLTCRSDGPRSPLRFELLEAFPELAG